MVRSSQLLRIGAGLYRILPASDHIDLVRGAVAALPDATASHQSAAHLLRFPKLPSVNPTVTVVSSTTHVFPGVTVRRTDDLAPEDRLTVDGLPCTSVARTLFDLARLLSEREFEGVGEALIIAERVTLEQFSAVSERLSRRGKPGSAASRRFIDRRSGHPGTVLERKGRDAISRAGLPEPIHEFPIPWRPRNRFDEAYPSARLAIEWDSRSWHEQRQSMRADRMRDRQAAQHGWVLVRFTWEDVAERPHELTATIRELLTTRDSS